MQIEQSNNHYSQTTLCQKCNHFIASQNFLLHQLRCNGIKQHFDFVVNPKQTVAHNNNNNIQNIQNTQEKIPCTYCRYQMTLKDLDTHPKQCIVKFEKCEFCLKQFPKEFLSEHFAYCEQKKSTQNLQSDNENEAYNNEYQEGILPQQDQLNDQLIYQYLNPSFYSDQYHNNNLRQQRSKNQSIQSYFDGKKRIVIKKYTDQDGNLIEQKHQEEIENNNRHHQPLNNFIRFPFRQIQEDRFSSSIFRSFRSNPSFISSPIMNFLGRIENMRNDNRNYQNRNGINQAQIKRSIKKIKFNKSNGNNQYNCCSICLNNFKEGQNLLKIRCGHLFHENCLEPWIQTNSNCPNCKESMRRNHQNIWQY